MLASSSNLRSPWLFAAVLSLSAACGEDNDTRALDAGADAAGNGGATADGGGDGPPSGESCGGIAGTPCAKDEFCNVAVSAGGTGCEDVADPSGICEPKAETCPTLYAPVCGCDRRSYSNACEANGQGTSVLHDGQCTGDDCAAGGGRAVYGDGVSDPSCADDEEAFPISGSELGLCCFTKDG